MLARLGVARVALEHAWSKAQCSKSCDGSSTKSRSTGTGQALVGHLRQEPVQAVAELVEQRAHVVGREQRRHAVRRLREVVVVDDDRQRLAVRPRLVAEARHPGAAALGRPREVVGQEHAHRPAVGALHLVGAHVGMVDGEVRTPHEPEAEQAPGAVERRLEHPVEHEVRLDLAVVQLVAGAAHLLRVVAPVPRLDRVRRAARARHRGERVAPMRAFSLAGPHTRSSSPATAAGVFAIRSVSA
jgi:hypothetical protein